MENPECICVFLGHGLISCNTTMNEACVTVKCVLTWIVPSKSIQSPYWYNDTSAGECGPSSAALSDF